MSDKNTNETVGAEMVNKLKAAGKKAEVQKAERRAKAVKGSHLLDTMESKARTAGLNIVLQSGFLKITGAEKGRQIYLKKKGGQVNLAGFTMTTPAVIQITEEAARLKHLGKVRGTLDFSQSDEAVLAAYESALQHLSTSASK